MTINEIVKETIGTLAKNRTIMTPENYMQIFCKIAKEKGVLVEDCEATKRHIKKLTDVLQKDLKKYPMQSQDALLTYLVATLNRVVGQSEGKQSLLLVVLVKQLLEVISLLHNKEAKELSSISLKRIESLSEANTFSLLIEKWDAFAQAYDAGMIEKLKAYYPVESSEFSQIIEELIGLAESKEDKNILEPFSSIMIAALAPSLSDTLDDDVATLAYELKHSPQLLADSIVQKEITTLIERRIKADKERVKERITSLDTLLGDVSSKIIRLIDKSHLSRDKIVEIKEELMGLDSSKHSFEMMQNKLITIANSLEIETTVLAEVMIEDKTAVHALQERVKKLESALSQAKKESRVDFLTNLISKRGLDEELNRAEKAYIRYNIEYSLCFFDLDKFKMLNDTFGHEAGDIVLKYTGKIMNDIKRDVDIFGRYGGEEFLAILPKTSKSGAMIFAQKIREGIEGFNFLYQGEALSVTVSGGVCERKDFDSQEAMIKGADALLYRAKEAGRNRIEG